MRIAPCGAQRGFVAQVGQVRARKPGGELRHLFQLHLRVQPDFLDVNFQDLYLAGLVRVVHLHLAVKMAGARARADSNRSRTRAAPTPTTIATNSLPEMPKNGTPTPPV